MIGNFTYLDIAIFVILCIGGIGGVFAGFISSFAKTAGYVVGFLAALMFTQPLMGVYMDSLNLGPFLSSLLAFVTLFVIGFVLMLVLGSILSRLITLSSGLEAVDRLLGFFWGVFVTLVVVGVVCYFLRMQTLVNVDNLFSGSRFITRLIQPLLPHAEELVKGALK